MQSRNKWKMLLLALALSSLLACKKAFYKQDKEFSDRVWARKDSILFEPEIKDTGLDYAMNIYLTHTDGYAYRNIILRFTTISPSQKTQSEQFDMPLADETGKWYGEWVGNIVDHKLEIKKHFKFTEAGKHKIYLSQQVRDGENLRAVSHVALALNVVK